MAQPSVRTENWESLMEMVKILQDGSQAIVADAPAGFVNNLKIF